jgi:polysaccharide pyruvyl transferase WcaK-like protein
MTESISNFENSKHIVIYGAVAHVAVLEGWRKRLRTHIKNILLIWRDILWWRLSGRLDQLNYKCYVDSTVVNRGDEAIAVASRRQFSDKSNNLSFINVNWMEWHSNSVYKNSKRIDLIAICGGGYIFLDGENKLPPRLADDLHELVALKIPVVFYGVGVNQLLGKEESDHHYLSTKDEITLRGLLDCASLISVRDKVSRELLSKYTEKPVRLVGDPALYFAHFDGNFKKTRILENESHPVIGIDFPFHGEGANRRIRKDLPVYIRMLKILQKATNCVFVYMLHFDAGRIIHRLIQNSGLQMKIIGGSPDALIAGYQSLNIHIGGMLHSCILAASTGTPSVALAYDVKHAGFFELLGLERYCLPATPFDADRFVAASIAALDEEVELRATIGAARARLEKEANAFVEDCVKLMNISED